MMQTVKRYAPTMPLICAGSSDGSLDAPADRGGPFSGAGAGSQSILSGLFLGMCVRMLAEVIPARKRTMNKCAVIAVSITARMILIHLMIAKTETT